MGRPYYKDLTKEQLDVWQERVSHIENNINTCIDDTRVYFFTEQDFDMVGEMLALLLIAYEKGIELGL